jgi:aspartate/methionine/tyrosine aminotransferase
MSPLAAWFHELDKANVAIRLDRGQLEMRPPPSLLAGGSKEIEMGSLSYGRALSDLVRALETDFAKYRGFDPSGAAIAITHGAIGGLAAVFQSMLRPRDRVLVPLPVWPAIPDLVCTFGGTAIPYPFATPEDAARLVDDLPRHHSAKFLVVNAPSNPAGVILTPETVQRLIWTARELDIVLIWDDAYETFLPQGPEYRSLTAQIDGSSDVVLLTTFSKRFAAPGLRVGAIRCPQRYGERIWDACLLQTGGIGRINQAAAASLLNEGDSFASDIAWRIKARRANAIQAFGSENLWNGGEGGGIYVLYRLPAKIDGWTVARRVLRDGVGVVPGEAFGLPGTIRLTLVCEGDQLALAVDALGNAARPVLAS